jgi:putative membrane protein
MNGSALIGALALAALVQPTWAQEPGSRPTREFVQASAQSDHFEISAAQTVLATSKDARVRDFAQRMLQAHSQTTRALADATVTAGLKPASPGMSSDQAGMLGALQSLPEPDLDQTYLRQQAIVHQSALAVTRTYAASGDAPAVRHAAAAAAAMIASHLAMAEQLQSNPDGQ